MPPGQLIVSGLLGTGKTLACEVLWSLGWEFGPRSALGSESLEHVRVLDLAKKVCAIVEPRHNAAYAIYDHEYHAAMVARLHSLRSQLKEPLPEAFKLPYPAALPAFCEVFGTKAVVWCARTDGTWAAHVKQWDFFYQKSEHPKPNLATIEEMVKEVLIHTLTMKAHFYIPQLEFYANQDAKRVLGFTIKDANDRLQALLEETGGRIGMNGFWAPDDPTKFPKIRRISVAK